MIVLQSALRRPRRALGSVQPPSTSAASGDRTRRVQHQSTVAAAAAVVCSSCLPPTVQGCRTSFFRPWVLGGCVAMMASTGRGAVMLVRLRPVSQVSNGAGAPMLLVALLAVRLRFATLAAPHRRTEAGAPADALLSRRRDLHQHPWPVLGKCTL